MSDPKPFTVSEARPLPIIVLADVSGSMAGDGKIDALNQAVRDMLSAFASSEEMLAQIHVAVITFGTQAQVHLSLAPAASRSWADMQASGSTAMGSAMALTADLLEDHATIPARAYRPTVVLVSDGQPTDAWEAGLARLTQQGRAQKADRMALAIGADADVTMLRRFLGDPEKKIFRAEDARRIKDFFRLVTMSVMARSRSASPNQVPAMQNPFDLETF
jgi:uncharacterized protein YegL